VMPVNQVRDRYLSSNCHKRVKLLQIILRANTLFLQSTGHCDRQSEAVHRLHCWHRSGHASFRLVGFEKDDDQIFAAPPNLSFGGL
jgi:hypothetical protein